MANEILSVHLSDSRDIIPRRPVLFDPNEQDDGLKPIAGSNHDSFNQRMINQLFACSGLAEAGPEEYELGVKAIVAGLNGIKPGDELEGMLAAQMVALHNAIMDSLRRGELNQASTLARTYIMQMEALDRHRGKGKQDIRVKHVHVNEGGQAIVGNVKPGRTRRRKHQREAEVQQDSRDADVQKTIEYKAEIPMQCEDAEWTPVPVAAGDGEEALPDAWRRTG